MSVDTALRVVNIAAWCGAAIVTLGLLVLTSAVPAAAAWWHRLVGRTLAGHRTVLTDLGRITRRRPAARHARRRGTVLDPDPRRVKVRVLRAPDLPPTRRIPVIEVRWTR